MQERIKSLFVERTATIIEMATQYALLSNAVSLAQERYTDMKEDIILSTLGGIPREFRSKFEIDVQFKKEDLIEKYQNELVFLNFKNFFTTTVAEIDYLFEDLYRILLEESGIEEGEIEKAIRNLWTNNNVYNYLINYKGFDLENNTNFKKLFFHYLQIRIVRHALVHSNGNLNVKQTTLIQQFNEQIGGANFNFLKTKIFSDNAIVIDFDNACNLRRYCIDFVCLLSGYFLAE
ncbi:hypothetical protein [Sphingobacterium spiritivorum]|uniref:hypothetical protein n=1 Tax=Sphingobacterium spiritivorum TaxID=258 RepID=UPI003DA64297